MHAKSGGSCGEPPDFLFIPAACRSRKDLPRSAGGEAGRGTRATVRGTQKTEPRARVRGAGDGGTGTGAGAGCGAAGAGCGARVRNTEDAGVGRRTQNAEHADADAGTGTGARGAGRRTRETRAAEHGKRGHGAQETGHRRRGTSPRAWNATRPHTPRQAPQQPAWTVHSRAPSATGTCNNPPGPSTAGHHPPRAAPYLSRVRIRITPLPPRTPYMLLPRCTSTDLTS